MAKRFNPVTSLSLIILRLLPSPVMSELMTSFAPPASVPVLIIFAVIPKLSSASFICSLSSARVVPAVTFSVKLPPESPIRKVSEPSVSATESEDDAKAASWVSILVPLARRSTVMSYSPVSAEFDASAVNGSVSSEGFLMVGSRPVSD